MKASLPWTYKESSRNDRNGKIYQADKICRTKEREIAMAFDPTNNQSVFDRVLAHCRKQEFAAYNPKVERCEYRTADGKKCAVGCLIDARDYDPCFEGQSVDQKFDRPLERLLKAKGFDLHLLQRLQRVHDRDMLRQELGEQELEEQDILVQRDAFESAMELVAKNWGLRYTRP